MTVKTHIDAHDLAQVLHEVLGLSPDDPSMSRCDTFLLGAVPQLDSMSAVALLLALEERFAIRISDDEVSGDMFHTVGSLVDFVNRQLQSNATRSYGSLA